MNFHLARMLLVASLCAACGQQSAPGPASSSASSSQAPRVDPARAGRVTGTVRLTGTPPANPPIDMGADPSCRQWAGPNPVDVRVITGADGALQNVFVHIKHGLDAYAYDVPAAPVVLDQRGCGYHPRVFGIRVGQPLEIVNSDATLHNIHANAAVNREFNLGQGERGMRSRRTFDKPEVMLPISCDVHHWMHAYAGVLDHPYFAVSTADGRFTLDGVPPGTYVLEAWHEVFGVTTTSVTLGDRESREVAFTFDAGRPSQSQEP